MSADDSPVPGLKLAYIGDDTSYLLYAGRWFPVLGYGVNRFTATINLAVPKEFAVVGSGGAPEKAAASLNSPQRDFRDFAPSGPVLMTVSQRGGPRNKRPTPAPAPKEKPEPAMPPTPPGFKTVTLVWNKPSFPGTVIAGRFQASNFNEGGLQLQVYFRPDHASLVSQYAEIATKVFQDFSTLYGVPSSLNLKLVELPDDTVPSAWAPEVAAIAGHSITQKANYRLLANTIAHQWWGTSVSPASRDDWWLNDGFARFSEARYTESFAGEAAYEEAMKDVDVGALAYDSVPLARVSTLDAFSPEFQALTTDKGAAILHMLRWVMGDVSFDKAMHQFATQYAGQSVKLDDFQMVCEQVYGQPLTWFFTQWLDSTGAPEFKNKYTVYRTRKGFRVVGEISQDLDLFRMPVELKIDTDGKSETKRIEVVGTNSTYSVETFGKPRRITIDPDSRVLENSQELKVRSAILRGQQLVQSGDLAEALREFQKALASNKNSSLAHYRIAEVFFLQRNYQASANEYRESLNGDAEPRWTEVWSHVQLGKIFDVTGQRERATNEYRQAIQTNDNTQNALEEARKYLQAPYQREKAKEGD